MALVQPIVVRPSTHFDTIAAAALASGVALASADLSADPWKEWLRGSFTKSVRRAKRPAEFDRVRLLDLPSAEIAVGDAVALSFAPQGYEEMPPAIRRLQVSGLDVPLERTVPAGTTYGQPGAAAPYIEINTDVAMSTGKAAAQVAHALGAWLLAQEAPVRAAWASEPGLSLGAASFGADGAHDPDGPGLITILDNGLTEIAPGTATARVYGCTAA